MSLYIRRCRQCGVPLPGGATGRRLYCSERCRRKFQDERRRDEREQVRELRGAGAGWMAPDPWSADRDDEYARWLVAGIDPLPAGYEAEADALAGPLTSVLPGKGQD